MCILFRTFLQIIVVTTCFQNYLASGNVTKELYRNTTEEQTDDNDKVYGGIEAYQTQFPYVVSVLKSGKHICGGSIISNYCIMTAAHCLAAGTKASTITVGAGTIVQPANYLNQFVIDKYVRHPKYATKGSGSSFTLINDIAILKLKYPLQFDDYKSPVALPQHDNQGTPAGATGTIMGWGKTEYSSAPTTDHLRYAYVPIISDSKCDSLYPRRNMLSSMVCAGNVKEGKVDTCQGDSGGPLIVNTVQVGIVSFGAGCGVPKQPGVYTEVSYFRNFLKDQ